MTSEEIEECERDLAVLRRAVFVAGAYEDEELGQALHRLIVLIQDRLDEERGVLRS